MNLVFLVLLVQEGSVVPWRKWCCWSFWSYWKPRSSGPPGPDGNKGEPGVLGARAPLARPVPVDSQERGVLPAFLEAREKRVKPVSEAKLVTQAEMAPVELLVPWVPWSCRSHW